MTHKKTINVKLINHLIEKNNSKALKKVLKNLPPFEIASFIREQSEGNQFFIFSILPFSMALQAFDYLPVHIQRNFLHQVPKNQSIELLKSLTPDDRTNFLQELPRSVVNELVTLLPYEERIETLMLLGYPEGSIGRLMTPDYIAAKIDWTIEQVLDHIRGYGHDSETIDIIYVVDDQGKLLDEIKLKDCLFVPRHFRVKNIANNGFFSLSVYDQDEEAIKYFQEYDRVALPVIDEQGVLLGIVTVDDVLRLSNAEATEDIQKIGGTEALNEPYMQAPFLELMKKRAVWLVILFIGEMLTATALGYFEKEIAKAVVLALFLPLIISSGGNAGSQASTLVIRAMALGEVKLRDWWKVVQREVLSGCFLGALLGSIGFFRVVIWSAFSNIYGEHWLAIAFTVGFSLIGVVLWGTLSGAILPLILKRVGVDPATSSAPFVSTLVDVTGLVIYFMIAISMLSGTLL